MAVPPHVLPQPTCAKHGPDVPLATPLLYSGHRSTSHRARVAGRCGGRRAKNRLLPLCRRSLREPGAQISCTTRPPDRPGHNLRLVVRANHPIGHQNEPKNAHYLPVLAPRMILQDAPNNDFHVWGPCARSCAPPPCPSQARERRRSAAGDPGVGGHMRFTAAFDTAGGRYTTPPTAPGPPVFGGLRFSSR